MLSLRCNLNGRALLPGWASINTKCDYHHTLATRPAALPALDPVGWAAMLYLGVVGGALTFYLWVFALGRTTPTRVAISVTVNPAVAALFGMPALGEPLGWPLLAGLAAVAAGIGVAATNGRRSAREPASASAAAPEPARLPQNRLP